MSGTLRKVWVLVCVIALSGAMVLVTLEPASPHTTDSKVQLNVTDKTVKPNEKILFFGELKQKHRKCRVNAKIILKQKGVGKIDTDRTDKQGEFRFKKFNPEPDRSKYFAKYKGKKRFGGGYSGYGYGATHKCRADKSRVIQIKPAA